MGVDSQYFITEFGRKAGHHRQDHDQGGHPHHDSGH